MKSFKYLLAVTALVGVATAAEPIFYPKAPDAPRIQFLTTINGASLLSTGANPYGNRFPGYETTAQDEKMPLVTPFGMASTNGKIYIANAKKSTVTVFNLAKKAVTEIGTDGPGKMKSPLALAIDTNGTSYVVDNGLDKVMVFDANDNFVTSFTADKSWNPVDIAIFKGNLYVVDALNSQIVVLDKTSGNFIARISDKGDRKGNLNTPTGIAIDSKGIIHVSNTVNGRIDRFTLDGQYLGNIGTASTTIGNFSRPKGVAFDKEDRLFVVDQVFENIQIFNNEKQLLLGFGTVGNVEGGVNLPARIAVDYNNVQYFASKVAPGKQIEYLIFVSNTTGKNKVNVYGMLKQ